MNKADSNNSSTDMENCMKRPNPVGSTATIPLAVFVENRYPSKSTQKQDGLVPSFLGVFSTYDFECEIARLNDTLKVSFKKGYPAYTHFDGQKKGKNALSLERPVSAIACVVQKTSSSHDCSSKGKSA